MKLSYVQLEINGTCPNECASCLPPRQKTGRLMKYSEITSVGNQMKAAGVEKVTFAGFGSPVDHPEYHDIVANYQCFDELSITCRSEDIHRIGDIDRANVSVQSVADVRKLVEAMLKRGAPNRQSFVPHIVLYAGTTPAFGAMLDILKAWDEYWEKISVAYPIVLCDDPRHVQYVKSESISPQAWYLLVKPLASDKLVIAGPEPRLQDCSWRKGGLFVRADLTVYPCCNLPCVMPIGDLHGETLKEIIETYPHDDYLSYCEKCPHFGG